MFSDKLSKEIKFRLFNDIAQRRLQKNFRKNEIYDATKYFLRILHREQQMVWIKKININSTWLAITSFLFYVDTKYTTTYIK